MFQHLLYLIGITMLPFLELRASIPYGILVDKQLSWPAVMLVCTLANIALGPVVYIFLDKFVHLFTRIRPIGNLYNKLIIRSQKKVQKVVDKYGELGVAIFIGIPLPGSGVYSGALGSHILGLSHKKFFIATVIGVIIAAILVTIASLTGGGLLSMFIKVI